MKIINGVCVQFIKATSFWVRKKSADFGDGNAAEKICKAIENGGK